MLEDIPRLREGGKARKRRGLRKEIQRVWKSNGKVKMRDTLRHVVAVLISVSLAATENKRKI